MNTVLNQLSQLLEDERNALLNGDLNLLGQIARQKDLLSVDLRGADPQQVRTLRQQAQHNQKLLDAARAGLRAVQVRLAAIQATRSGALGYRADGSSTAALPQTTYERRS